MTALEYMERQLKKHTMNLERERKRGAPEEVLDDIALKISYYEEAVEDMRGMFDAVPVVRCGECERRDKSADLTRTVWCKVLRCGMRKDSFCSYGERKEESV